MKNGFIDYLNIVSPIIMIMRVVVTHNKNVAKFAKRITWLKDGKIIKDERK